jgi:Protein of unknown function (DUF1064)
LGVGNVAEWAMSRFMTSEQVKAHKRRTAGARKVTFHEPEKRGPQPKKPSKYRNTKTVVNGITFDSQKEAKRYGELKYMEISKQITKLKLQPTFKCVVNGLKVCDYRADFSYTLDGKEITEDVKGMKTAMYRLKKKLVKACFGIEILET